MLLKNMTAMNFEALSLFQHTTVPSALEQQQSMGELKDIISTTADISCIERDNKGNNTPGTVRNVSRAMSTPFTSNTNISHRGNDNSRSNRQMEYFDEETPRKSPPMPPTLPSSRVPLGESKIQNQNPNVNVGKISVASDQGSVGGGGMGTGIIKGFNQQLVTRPPHPPLVQSGDRGVHYTSYTR